ncbi:MAG: 3-phosphoshikimate 1-carboxyvinyltransferase [Planctomycetota bacterium]
MPDSTVTPSPPDAALPDPYPVQPIGPFSATLSPPGSKSLTNRALLIAALADGPCTLTGVLFADDTRVMLDALQTLGFELTINEPDATVTVRGRNGRIPTVSATPSDPDEDPTPTELFLGNAGTATRFLTAALTLGRGTYQLDGIPRMRQRPIGELVDALAELEAVIDYDAKPGYPPLTIHGNGGLPGGEITLQPTLSSQFISALLLAGPHLDDGLTIRFDGEITSLPYVKMTIKLMEHFGVKPSFKRDANGDPYIRVRPAQYAATDYTVEPDASNASYFLAAAAAVPGSDCTIDHLGSRSLQGDAEFCDLLGRMGCTVIQKLESTHVAAPPDGKLLGIDADLNRMPDMAQTLAVLALFAEGPTTIRNVGNLRVKETDRLDALETELTKLGATAMTLGDDLTIHPPPDNQLTADDQSPVLIETYDDHRMAMAFAVAGLRHPGIHLADPACVNKTYPTFFDDLATLSPRNTSVA